MLSYGQLDAIADASNPAMGVACLLRLCWLLSKRRWRDAAWMIVVFPGALVVAYGWERIDLHFGLWPGIGLDYSTHTAVAVAAGGVLWMFWASARIAWAFWLLAYAALMLWQRYHTVGDILTTALVVAFCLTPLLYLPAVRTVARLERPSPAAP
jgi:hypothetical protein